MAPPYNVIRPRPEMKTIVTAVLGALALGFAVGWLARTRLRGASAPRRVTPFDPDEYLQQLDRLSAAYSDGIKEYDRLVTWVSGGALAASVTFLEKFGRAAAIDIAGWKLIVGWGLLGAALFASLYSQYCSSRIYSWRLRELRHLQIPPADRSNGWEREAIHVDRIAKLYGSI